MEFLKTCSDDEITRLIKEHWISENDLIEVGRCPVCFDFKNKHVLYQNMGYEIFYEDDQYECFLVYHLRQIERILVYPKKHFSSMLELDSDFNDFFAFVQKMINLFNEKYDFELLDLHSVAKDSNNHLYIELIPHNVKIRQNSFKKLKK